MMTRRIFMHLAAATAAGLGVCGLVSPRRRLALGDITPGSLESLRRGPVTLVRADGRAFGAVMEDAALAGHPARPGAPATEQVSLVFAPDESGMEEGTYRVEGPDLVLGDLYLTAVGAEGRDRRLEAVITRIV